MLTCQTQRISRGTRTISLRRLLLCGTICIGVFPAGSAWAQTASELESLRAELAALKQVQAETDARIRRVETAISAMDGTPMVEHGNASTIAPMSASRLPGGRVFASGSEPSRLNLSGDVRVRYEANQGDDDARNRHRGVVRARIRGTYAINENFTAGAQLSTGDDDDPNTADVTLDNFDDDLTVSLDQIYVKAKFGSLTLVGGKIPQPFKRTDLVWDGDVSPQGLSSSYLGNLSDSTTVKANALFFQIDEASTASDTSMIGGQLELASKLNNVGLNLAVGYYDYRLRTLGDADSGDFRSNLRKADGSYLSDFNLLDVIGSISFGGLGERWPITLTGDYVHNFGAAVDANTGFSGDIAIGRTSKKGDWKFGYGYAQTEVDAVFAAFSHDNLGIATNYRLHTLTIDYVPMPHTGLNLTWYHYRPLEALYAGGNAPGDWLNRVRLNLMVDF